MEYRALDITVVSAEGLKNVNIFTKMDVYVLVSVHGESATHRTPVDKNSGSNPRWNHPIKFYVNDNTVKRFPLLFRLKSERTLGDKHVGDVIVPIIELDNSDSTADSERVVEYQVRTTSGKPKGTLKFSYKFGEKIIQDSRSTNKLDEPVTAYPAPVGANASYQPTPGAYQPPPGMMYGAYPLPPQGYAAYPQPPPQYGGGYGGYPPAGPGGYPPYPHPQQMGYGYQQVQQPKKKMGGGSKLGLGLGAGLLGGLLVGDMISDVGEMAAYDSGYDAGFDDAGDFEF